MVWEDPIAEERLLAVQYLTMLHGVVWLEAIFAEDGLPGKPTEVVVLNDTNARMTYIFCMRFGIVLHLLGDISCLFKALWFFCTFLSKLSELRIL